LSLPEVTDIIFRERIVNEPHLIGISAIRDFNAGVGAILKVERLTLISQNWLGVDSYDNHNNLGANREPSRRQRFEI
jgi:hypothetical protein